jgi:hypothetical protein
MRVFFITSESLQYHNSSHKGWDTLWQIQNVTQNLVHSKQTLEVSVSNILDLLLVYTPSKTSALIARQKIPIAQMISKMP